MTSNVNWLAAITFYLLLIVSVVLFAVAPAVERGSWLQALLIGALFGLISYATYDLTTLAGIGYGGGPGLGRCVSRLSFDGNIFYTGISAISTSLTKIDMLLNFIPFA